MDYTREAFTFPAGNVRVTLDYDIRTGLDCTAMLDTGCVTVPVPGEPAILEVKWDEFLPDIVRYAVCLLYTSPSPRDGLLSRMPSSA